MSEKIVPLNKGQIKELIRGSVEETFNRLLETEAEDRQGCCRVQYGRNLTTTL